MPDGGEILIDGQSASRPDWVLPPYQRDLSMVFQTRRSGRI
jgi:ABC-type Fe3+/spermidine/putrescine transport system ATPase subunit